MRLPSSNTVCRRKRWLAALLGLVLGLAFSVSEALADEGEVTGSSEQLLTSFEQIWRLSGAERRQWHRVRLEYVVYYYDPLWSASWGRCGEAESYLSLGPTPFPIKAGQRVLIEGSIQPSEGMRVAEPQVRVLAESAPIEVLSTTGQLRQSDRFNKRVVTVEGYVDRQNARDANHLEFTLIAEGEPVLAFMLWRNEAPLPQLAGRLVKAKGVYFARSESAGLAPTIELWVQGGDDVTVVGSLENDPRFEITATPVASLPNAPPKTLIRMAGTVKDQKPGRRLVLQDETGEAVVHSCQSLVLEPEERVEAIGYPLRTAEGWGVGQAVFRRAQKLLTSVTEVWALPEAERHRRHRVRFETLVYYFDPGWKVLWGRVAGNDDYLSLGPEAGPIRSGQRVLIEGSVLPANNMTVEPPRVTVLQDRVPLDPIPTKGRIGLTEAFNKKWVSVEAHVDRLSRKDSTHAELDLVVEGHLMVGRLLLEPEEGLPSWEDARLRLNGVYTATQDPTGGVPSLELWIPGTRQAEVLGWLKDDERFQRPATPIDQLSSARGDSLVRVVGTVRSQRPGTQLTIRDETGQLSLETVQTRLIQVGEAVEAIGYPKAEGTRVVLRNAVFRRSEAAPLVVREGLPKLRLADQLRELQPEEAARGYPVQLSGVVTWARPNADFCYVMDASGGVRVYYPPDFTPSFYAGTKIEVAGTTAPGRFTPVVLASAVHTYSTIELPDPRPVTLEQAQTGVEEGQWISMSGYVRGATITGPWSRLELTTSGGEFQALLGAPHDRWAKLVGSVVRVVGVCSALTNDKRQLTGVQLWVPMSRFVEIEDPAPRDPFAFPTRSIASLRQFSSINALNRRVRVAGTVIYQEPGRVIQIQDETDGLLVLSQDQAPLSLGDQIEAVGFPGRQNNRIVLRESVYRRMGAAPEPAPLPVASIGVINEELDGRLVQVNGRLLDVGTDERGIRLLVEQEQALFDAVLPAAVKQVPDDWVAQTQVALTGVYTVQLDEYRRPQALRIKLRTPADVAVLRRPPWWTAKRALGATGALAVVMLLGFGWLVALRRRVSRQHGVILEQVESERAARLEAALARASKLESLGVLAGGLAHDFNNLLTVIMGNLSLAKVDPRIEPDTVRCLTESEKAALRARDLTQQLLTFAKGGNPMRVATRLPDLVREAAQFALHGANVRCTYTMAPDLWLASVDKGQFGQVVHNIVLNASQAMPAGGVIQITLQNEEVTETRAGLVAGKYVRLSFADSGSGIAPEHLPRIFEPYFSTKPQSTGLGLATVYSIVRKHDGHIEASSRLREGTNVTVWLPAAPEPTVPVSSDLATLPHARRVLLMDDESSIRLLASTILKRAGYEVVAVDEGAAAVNEFAGARAAGRPFDLVILDLTVPGGMGGGDAMAKLREMDPAVRAIVSSGYSSDPIMANYRAHGFSARVPKPYQASELLDVVRSVQAQAK